MVDKALSAMGVPKGAPIPPTMKMPLAGLALANSDIAFQGNRLFLGNFYGIDIYDIENPERAKLITSLICPGGQGDVSVYKNLLFMSVEMGNGRLDCGEQGFAPQTSGTAAGRKRSFPRRPHFRHLGHQESEAGRCGSDMPRLAHAYAGDDPKDSSNVTSTFPAPPAFARRASGGLFERQT